MLSALLIAVIVFALAFEFINGFHDTANAIAASIYTRALTPRRAIMLTAVMNLIGALVSEKVAETITKGLVDVNLELYVVLAALMGAILWNLFTWWNGIPSSSSHALIGSLVGAVIVYTMSLKHIQWETVLMKVVIPLFTSPIMGLIVGFLAMKLVYKLFVRWSQAKVNRVFRKLQVVSSAIVAFSHGNNDAQKTMGIITLALVTNGLVSAEAGVPMWVKISCACVMALGTSVGGWRVMKTMGSGVTKIQPASGFAAQVSAALVIEAMTHMGAPVSTTQTITTSIMGTGAARRMSMVRWGMAEKIFAAWFVTLPAAMALGAGCAFVIDCFV